MTETSSGEHGRGPERRTRSEVTVDVGERKEARAEDVINAQLLTPDDPRYTRDVYETISSNDGVSIEVEVTVNEKKHRQHVYDLGIRTDREKVVTELQEQLDDLDLANENLDELFNQIRDSRAKALVFDEWSQLLVCVMEPEEGKPVEAKKTGVMNYGVKDDTLAIGGKHIDSFVAEYALPAAEHDDESGSRDEETREDERETPLRRPKLDAGDKPPDEEAEEEETPPAPEEPEDEAVDEREGESGGASGDEEDGQKPKGTEGAPEEPADEEGGEPERQNPPEKRELPANLSGMKVGDVMILGEDKFLITYAGEHGVALLDQKDSFGYFTLDEVSTMFEEAEFEESPLNRDFSQVAEGDRVRAYGRGGFCFGEVTHVDSQGGAPFAVTVEWQGGNLDDLEKSFLVDRLEGAEEDDGWMRPVFSLVKATSGSKVETA